MTAPAEVTGLLLQWSEGDPDALRRLLPVVYDEIRRMAGRQLRRERADHTLNPTALVHELYLRLVDQRRIDWKNRAQFFGISAELMRRVLVDYARSRLAAKRGGSRVFVSLDEAQDTTDGSRVAEMLALDEALDRLSEHDPDLQRIVELRFFAGLTVEETAHVLGRSPRTIKREWQLAKAWLYRELHEEPPAFEGSRD